MVNKMTSYPDLVIPCPETCQLYRYYPAHSSNGACTGNSTRWLVNLRERGGQVKLNSQIMPVRRGEALVRDCDLGHTHVLRRYGHNSTIASIASISTEHHLSSQKVCILYLFDCHSRLSSPCCWRSRARIACAGGRACAARVQCRWFCPLR